MSKRLPFSQSWKFAAQTMFIQQLVTSKISGLFPALAWHYTNIVLTSTISSRLISVHVPKLQDPYCAWDVRREVCAPLHAVAKMDSSNYLQGRNRYSRTSKRSRRGLSDDIFKQYYKVAEACGKGKPFVEHVLQVTGFACQSVISIWCDCFLSSSFGLLGRIATPIQPWQVVVLTTHTGGSQDSRVATKCIFVELSTDLVQELILLGINTHLMNHDSRSHESLMIMTPWVMSHDHDLLFI